ncbi:Cell fate regulator YaaT, PSP1 superfamily (controls sporulation, competence, biofilm development) [Polaribacter sp. Hel1_33_78]|uniref:PSP1 domain-containing protein n=1 Tax=Polaribacter sp. Hel1_33_78 TaxID=1336804 RepID=UPI00087DE292|nr:regulatory iron-sulfur-containing complex subunit RicT [Polaribacter sp. Hel1_33_78]SDU25057.1 Cell fate regulator YaaT, PSP1 superfamily (controls sporulation, competence, biofilm development) [Polaribacter sp. Hel1_33_78]
MACGSCGTTENGVPKGCKSNGNCGTGTCGSGSEKLAVFDWLSNMTLPSGEERFNIFEIRFKNGRKHFFKNTENLTISMGDVVAVESSPGHDVGTVSLAGELVKVQMKKRKISHDSEEIKKIYRKASQKDIDIWQATRAKEVETQRRGREILGRLGLQMKLSDVEYQGDGNKATFYYTAEARVDFRQLIRDLASAFSIRVEMKQVGARQEAARLGGVGSCGRELCCSTWLTDFRKVSTSAARYQQLSLNPLKLSGQCGKLKCCLNFELDTYLDALKSFPKQDVVLKTEKGEAVFIKMDIFKKHLWYTYKQERFKWFRLTLEQVQEIIELNKNDEKSVSLEEYESDIEIPEKVNFEDAVGQDSLTRFDAPKTSKRRRNNRKKKPVAAGVKLSNGSSQKQQQNRKSKQNPNQKQKPVAKPGANTKPNQPKAEGVKANKPRRNNRNRNNNRSKNGNDSQEK